MQLRNRNPRHQNREILGIHLHEIHYPGNKDLYNSSHLYNINSLQIEGSAVHRIMDETAGTVYNLAGSIQLSI